MLHSREVGSSRLAVAVAALVGLLGAGLLVLALVRQAPSEPSVPSTPEAASSPASSPASLPTPAPPRTTRGAQGGGTADLITGPVLPAAAPVRVSIPRIGVSSTLETLGVDGETGAMEVPQDPAKAGWYHLGPTPGALGPAVIAGHVTWNQVPAVFYSLAELRPGDEVDVARRDDRVAVFEVTDVRRFAKSEFPTRSVFGAIDHAGLRLITCGGDFDSSAHRYSDNVVVFARLVDTA